MRFILFSFLVISLCLSCTSDTTTADNSVATDKIAAKEETKPAKTKYRVTPFTPSPEFEDAEITSMDYKNGKFDFKIGGDSYKLGDQTTDAPRKMCANSAKGQHLHIIVDNGPYAAKYESSFDMDIPDGGHHFLAFLSRSYHESIKTDKAHVARYMEVKNGSIASISKFPEPMLFYSRPKGTYVGLENTKRIMLDFYVANVEIGTDYFVKADINGEEHLLKYWQPYYVDRLPLGENQITLSLVDKDGKLVDAPLNPVTRKFTLKADPVEKK